MASRFNMIYEIFSNNLRSVPDATAIVTSRGQTLSYSNANLIVHQWANYLMTQGVGEGDRVAVLLDNEDHHVFIFLALDRINACYVPYDADVAKLQLAAEIEELGLKKFIIEETLSTEFNIPDAIKLTLSATELGIVHSSSHEAPSIPYNTNGFEKTVYIVPSSGSKKRKLIPVLGAGLRDYWSKVLTDLFEKEPLGKVLATRNPAWDASKFEYLLAFNGGGELHLLDRFQRRDWTSILATCEKSSINCLLIIASQLNAGNCADIVPKLANFGVKHLMVTGDACSFELKAMCEKENVKLWNGYGPTEGPIGLSLLCVNDIHIKDETGHPLMPIGKPHGYGVHCHIDDGKLLIESPYLTPGYINPEDNKSAFTYKLTDSGETIRLFATGDYFYEHESKYLIFQGRDGFCKIDDVKIFPQDIEQQILNYNNHSTAGSIQATVVIKEHLGATRLFAYLVKSPDFDDDAFITYLRNAIKKEEFPILLNIDAFPILSTSGKINKKALVALEDKPESFFFHKKKENSEKQLQPFTKNDHLQSVKDIWCELFMLDDVPVDVEFSVLGGKSLMLSMMVNKIKERLDPTYTFLNIAQLKTTTITSIANSIIEKTEQPYDQAFIKLLVFRGKDKNNIYFLPALLGEGNFSYSELAEVVAEQFDCNIYGLSDPGIYDEAWLPTTMDHAVSRYVKAIKKIPQRDKYELFGYSFGATLAYKVAEKLLIRCDLGIVPDVHVHLIDGYPPTLYQALPKDSHAKLLQSLINFMVITLNNTYYAEEIKPFTLSNYSEFEKLKQIEHCFDELEQKLTHPISKNTLNIARRHLTFLLMEKKPQKLPFTAIFYLTNRQQPYHQVINEIPDLSKRSSDYHYYYWSQYFRKITLCGEELFGDHLSVLLSAKTEPNKSTIPYWTRENDSVINMELSDVQEGPAMFHRFEPIDTQHHRLAIYFLPCARVYHIAAQLTVLGLSPNIIRHDQNLLITYDGKDTIYNSTGSLCCNIPQDKVEQVRSFISTWEDWIRHQKTGLVNVPDKIVSNFEVNKLTDTKLRNIDLVIFLNDTPLLTLSFKYYNLPKYITRDIRLRLRLIPAEDDGDNLIYHHTIRSLVTNIYHALWQAEEFLARFITVISAYTAESCPTISELKGRNNAKKAFPGIVREEFNKRLNFILEDPSLREKELNKIRSICIQDYESILNEDLLLEVCIHCCAEDIWETISDIVTKKLFDEYGFLYQNNIMSHEFQQITREWRCSVPDMHPFVDQLFIAGSKDKKEVLSLHGFFSKAPTQVNKTSEELLPSP